MKEKEIESLIKLCMKSYPLFISTFGGLTKDSYDLFCKVYEGYLREGYGVVTSFKAALIKFAPKSFYEILCLFKVQNEAASSRLNGR